MKKQERIILEDKIRERYLKLKGSLTERARRLFIAGEALSYGYGGIATAARPTGAAPSAIGRGLRELRELEEQSVILLPLTRIRRPGGGRKRATEEDPTLLTDLKALVDGGAVRGPNLRGEIRRCSPT